MTLITERLVALGHTPATALPPAATYVAVVRTGNLLLISGQISETDEAVVTGRLGAELSLEQGQKAAELAGLGLIAQIAAATDGTLAAVARILRLQVYVAATPEFTRHSAVANGASDLLVAVFGPAGAHVRTAIGVASLPLGAAVEVDAMIELAV